MGDKVVKGAPANITLPPGGFALMPANMNHFAYTVAETTIILYGTGPVEFNTSTRATIRATRSPRRVARHRPGETRGRCGTFPSVPLVSLDRVSIAFGHLPLLDGIALQIDARERVSVIGRNGTGKSTLLKIVNGDLAPDAGRSGVSPR